jgi:hypothetical protein
VHVVTVNYKSHTKHTHFVDKIRKFSDPGYKRLILSVAFKLFPGNTGVPQAHFLHSEIVQFRLDKFSLLFFYFFSIFLVHNQRRFYSKCTSSLKCFIMNICKHFKSCFILLKILFRITKIYLLFVH